MILYLAIALIIAIWSFIEGWDEYKFGENLIGSLAYGILWLPLIIRDLWYKIKR